MPAAERDLRAGRSAVALAGRARTRKALRHAGEVELLVERVFVEPGQRQPGAQGFSTRPRVRYGIEVAALARRLSDDHHAVPGTAAEDRVGIRDEALLDAQSAGADLRLHGGEGPVLGWSVIGWRGRNGRHHLRTLPRDAGRMPVVVRLQPGNQEHPFLAFMLPVEPRDQLGPGRAGQRASGEAMFQVFRT